jgi:queuine tRNA-ribosyltransferase
MDQIHGNDGDSISGYIRKRLTVTRSEETEVEKHASKKIKSSKDQPDGKNVNAEFLVSSMPPELQSIDFSERIAWGKYYPYADHPFLHMVPINTPPSFTPESPALCFQVHAISGRARATSMYLLLQNNSQQQQKSQPDENEHPLSVNPTGTTIHVPTPIFMPVGTKGCLKALTFHELVHDPALSCPIMLANTYHLAASTSNETTELVRNMGGLHNFQGMNKILEQSNSKHDKSNTKDTRLKVDLPNSSPRPYGLLTDSGGFQMVSLAKLSQVTEEGVSFENPYRQKRYSKQTLDHGESKEKCQSKKDDDDDDGPDLLLLRPEDSIRHQNNIGANIIMALDDVVSSVAEDPERFVTATHRTLRWYDRCYAAHTNKHSQSLFPIVQGGLDVRLGGLREQCLAGFRHRQVDLQYITPGYAIGGLAGGEDKDDFWKVIDACCKALPDDKPRYAMGIGYPLDLVVCTALGVDMYDCVYPTRTARFGVALVPGPAPGTLRLRSHQCASETTLPIQEGCPCQACSGGTSRARLHGWLKANNPLATQLVTQHNVAYMMTLVRNMRQAILEDRYSEFAKAFIRDQYRGKSKGGDDVPGWVQSAMEAAGITLE